MRATAMLLLLPAALFAVGCSNKDRSRADDELKKDLALAASDGLGMAPTPQTHTISAIEEAGTPVAKPQPQTRKAPKKGTARAPRPVVEPTVTEEKATDVVLEPSETPTTVAASPESTATTEEPIPTPRPRPIPVGVPAGAGGSGTAGTGDGSGSSEGRGGGSGVGAVIGTVIGVIIRGGVVGDDHCDPRTDGRRGRGGMGGYPGTVIRGIPVIPLSQPNMPIPRISSGMVMPRR